jgi:FkbM family methyltransferase
MSLLQKLDAIERLAKGSVIHRLLHHPFRYLAAIAYWRLLYPLEKKGKFARARTFFGAGMEVVLPSATEIFLFGAKTHDSEIRLARFLINHLRPGDVFCDVGAHFGYFTLLAAHLVGEKGRVFSFEASRSTYCILAKNTTSSANVHALHLAATDEAKTLIFNEFPALFSEYNSLVLPDPKAAWLKMNPPQRIEVQGIRLDDFFQNQPPPRLLKIDVEGAELQVLRGMRRLLQEHPPLIVMEYLINGGDSYPAAVAFAKSAGYETLVIGPDGRMLACNDLGEWFAKRKLNSDNIVFKKNQA